MNNTKNTESTRIETLIPQQLVSDSNALINFLKEYYNFLSQSNQPISVVETILQNKDLDYAVDRFISIIEKEIGYGMVSNIEANKNNLYKHIEEFYDCKGSLDSFKLLFRILYNVDIEIFLPKQQILIASDGRWSQQNSLHLETINGDVFSLVNTTVDVLNPDGSKISVEVERVKFFRDNIYEINIAQNFIGKIQKNSTITSTNYSGKLVDALSVFSIVTPGKNFSIGDILEVNDGINENTKSLIKVTKVNGTGGILDFEFIRFGIDYQNDFTSYLIPVNYDLDFESDPSNYGFTADKFGRVFETLKTNNYFSLELNPYSINYFSENYLEGFRSSGNFDSVYNQKQSNSNNINQEIISDTQLALQEAYDNRAIIEFKLDPLSKYGGSFSTNNGFLSDDIYLQDNDYYQAYSYVIKSDKRFNDYKNIVYKTVHPVGMAMFGQYEITNDFDVSSSIELLVRMYSERLTDSIDTIENIARLIIKPVADEIVTSEFWYYDYNKPLLENVSLIEFIEKKITGKPQFDTITISDIINDILFYKNPSDAIVTSEDVDVVLNRRLFDSIGAIDSGITEQANIYSYGYFAQEYSEGLVETGVDKDVFKVLNTTVTVRGEISIGIDNGSISDEIKEIEESVNFVYNKSFVDSITTPITIRSAINKPLENSINTSEFGIIDKNSYSLRYFAEPYVDGISNFN